MPATSSEREHLRQLLHVYLDRPHERARIAAEIEQRFRRPVAILAVDACSFSRNVQAMGIVHSLAHLERLKQIVDPVIEQAGGSLLRTEADNIFALFPEPAAAVRCAEAILAALGRANAALPSDDAMHVSIGVGYGEALVIGTVDVYGSEMNLACKLGEDYAQRDEVLITPAAYAALGSTPWQFDEVAFDFAGLSGHAYRLTR